MELLTTREVAKRLGLSRTRVKEFAAEGRLVPVRSPVKGVRGFLFPLSSVLAFARRRPAAPGRSRELPPPGFLSAAKAAGLLGISLNAFYHRARRRKVRGLWVRDGEGKRRARYYSLASVADVREDGRGKQGGRREAFEPAVSVPPT